MSSLFNCIYVVVCNIRMCIRLVLEEARDPYYRHTSMFLYLSNTFIDAVCREILFSRLQFTITNFTCSFESKHPGYFKLEK